MGIIQRAKILEKKMTQKQKEYMSLTLMRLLHKNLMGGLFKVIFAFKSKKNNFLGFELMFCSKKLIKFKNIRHGFFNREGGVFKRYL